MSRKRDDARLVYSTGQGDLRGARSRDEPRSPRSRPRDATPADGVARVRREVKGRRGKTVTTVAGLPLAEAELRSLAGDLKRACGTGGSAKDGVIEIQGDHRDGIVAALEERGFTVKRAGG